MKGRVGKTSILNKYINNKFNDAQEMTINSGYLEKDVTFDNDRFTFCFWVIICNIGYSRTREVRCTYSYIL